MEGPTATLGWTVRRGQLRIWLVGRRLRSVCRSSYAATVPLRLPDPHASLPASPLAPMPRPIHVLWAPFPPLCSSLYTKRYALTVVSSSFGPWLSLALFHFLGNQWHAHDCRLVLGSGLLLMVAPLALMCCFDDDQTLEAQQLRARQATGQQGGQQLEGGQHSGGQRQLEGGPAALPACADGELAGCRDSGSNAGVPPAGSAPAAEVAEAAETGAAGSLLAVAANGHASCPPSEACTGSDGALPVAAAAGRAAVQPAAATVLGAAGPSASDLLSLSELGGQAKAQGQHGAAGCCAWLPPGLAVTVLISCSDFIGALASGGCCRALLSANSGQQASMPAWQRRACCRACAKPGPAPCASSPPLARVRPRLSWLQA